ncbi:MAG TPA: LLM class flavin-dependent oxidoreductase [Candidatus Angelobacter sp.]|nr:LLM class flavin-dependent oxidoreductase [Candidatus Angelobacter sp.]
MSPAKHSSNGWKAASVDSDPLLRFHWRLIQGGERAGASRAYQSSLSATGLPDLLPQIEFCRQAEECGIDSLLVDFGWSKPDSIVLSTALGLATQKIRLIVAYRSGLLCPTSFVQQLNTLSHLIQGRFSLNIVAGSSPDEQAYYGDFLSHDERYDRTEEFLAICNALWRQDGAVDYSGRYYRVEKSKLNTPFYSPERTFPEIYIAGNSPSAQRVSISQGTCWMRFPETPHDLAGKIRPVLESGKEVGLRLSIIARPTREEAVAAAYELLKGADAQFDDRAKEKELTERSDSLSIKSLNQSSEWGTSSLWTGAVRTHGPAAVALVGAPDEIASAILEYKSIGITQFILSGWPKLESMLFFGREVLPLVRTKERALIRKEPPASVSAMPAAL